VVRPVDLPVDLLVAVTLPAVVVLQEAVDFLHA
jgi:hypothetical protein